jgi:hypothetical protein
MIWDSNGVAAEGQWLQPMVEAMFSPEPWPFVTADISGWKDDLAGSRA